jgi:hypothetical protein
LDGLRTAQHINYSYSAGSGARRSLMIPLLAPLLGSLAGSLLPATLGTGIAGALGLKGAMAGLVAAAAPKAIGAGIGTLLAGGDLGDAALNAVGFGAGSALLGGAGAGAAGSTGAAAAAAPTPVAPPPAAVPTDAVASAIDPRALTQSAQQIARAFGGGQQSPPAAVPMGQPQQPPRNRASDNPMLAPLFGAQPNVAGPMSTPTTVPSVGAQSMMPASVGIGSIPMAGQQPMSNDMMLAGMSPNQSDMVNQYLRSRNMVGFA